MQSQPTGLRWEPFEPRSPNAGAGHSADAVKKAVSPGLEWRSWRTIGSQSRESFIPGPTSVSPSGTRGKSRMHQGARTDPCGGREVTRAPTATKQYLCIGAENLRKLLCCNNFSQVQEHPDADRVYVGAV